MKNRLTCPHCGGDTVPQVAAGTGIRYSCTKCGRTMLVNANEPDAKQLREGVTEVREL